MTEDRVGREDVASLLERIADLLAMQGANRFRIQSYRDGGRTVRATDADIISLAAQKDEAALRDLPDIGEGLARVIVEFVTTGRSTLYEELQGEVSPEQLFQQVPGIGPELAQGIASELDVHTLPELEQAAHDGRLAQVEGFGQRRLESVRATLAGMLSGAAQSHRRQVREEQTQDKGAAKRPTVKLLLEVDADYRRRAKAGELKKIAPKRFNPDDEAWLPIMHTTRQGWDFTALFSNTALAHDLNKTDDWVVIYWEATGGSGAERQNTVVTETSGPLAGKRVVRGREDETRRHYRSGA